MSAMDLMSPKKFQPTGRPATAQSTDIFDVMGASFDATMDNFRVNSESSLIQENTERRDKQYKEKTGRSIYDDAAAFMEDPGKYVNKKTGLFDKNNPEVQSAIDKLLNQIGETEIPTSAGVIKMAEDQARNSLAKQEQVMAGATPANQIIGGLAGSFGAMFFDPLNIATLPLGAGASTSILKTIAIEAGINAGAEALSQPFVAEWQNQIGQKYGFTDALQNVGLAGIFGAAIPATGRVISLGIEKAPYVARSGMELFDNLTDKFKKIDAPEAATASTYMARSAHLGEADIAKLNKAIEPQVHKMAMDEVNAAINEGRLVNSDKIKVSNDDLSKMDPKLSESSFQATTRRYAEPIPESGRVRETKDTNPIFVDEKPEPASIERQKEIEDQRETPEAIKQEEMEFLNLMNEVENMAVDFKPDESGALKSSMSLRTIMNDIKKDSEYVSAIRSCAL